jgi:Zn-dependent protease
MIKPEALSLDQEYKIVGHIFDAPLVVIGNTWFPMAEIIVWGLMAHEAGRLHPERNWPARLGVAALTMPVILGSEWCHNMAHAAAAKLVGYPADALRISWGMPLLVYHDIEDPNVTPRVHILRALGGPVINIIFLSIAAFLHPLTELKSVTRDVVSAGLGMNAFLILAGMLPIPGLDGGVALKWALVQKGKTPAQADEAVRKVDVIVAVGLGIGSAAAFKKRKRLFGGIMAMFAAIALAVGTGLLKEKA